MDKRIGMQHLNSAGNPKHNLIITAYTLMRAYQTGRGADKCRPHPLASVQGRVAHGVSEPCGMNMLSRKIRTEPACHPFSVIYEEIRCGCLLRIHSDTSRLRHLQKRAQMRAGYLKSLPGAA